MNSIQKENKSRVITCKAPFFSCDRKSQLPAGSGPSYSTAFWFTPIPNYLEFSHPSLLQSSLGHLSPTPSFPLTGISSPFPESPISVLSLCLPLWLANSCFYFYRPPPPPMGNLKAETIFHFLLSSSAYHMPGT